MKSYLIIFFTILYCNSINAQLGKEAWHWQFGNGASLDFSSGSPVSGTASSISVLEGSASISDPVTGQLLFYTDGTSVWNKNNIQMPNGFGMIGGLGSSTQAALIIPKPGSSTIYYLISADQGGYGGPNQGVNYSIVDMSLAGGLGDVVAGSKNLPLTPPPATEKLVGIKHCNGTDYWIITHPFNSNAFNAYQVTSAGINTTPVVSNVGTAENNVGGFYDETIGYLKASPNGKKLALGIYEGIPILEIYDFNPSTGQITNPITITYPGNSGPYGVSFSPDNSKLYAGIFDANQLYQYDLSSGVSSTIIASQVLIANPVNPGALQIGPDGKIYMALYGGSLSVINSPNLSGAACNYQAGAINISPGSCEDGLPNFIDADGTGTVTNISNAVQCNIFTTDTLKADTGFTSYQWSTGATTQTIVINSPGTYWVTSTNTTGCTLTDTIKAYTINPSSVHILKDTIVCSPTGNYTANATYNGATGYLWYDGSTNPIKTLSSSGTYSVNIYFPGGCVVKDSFNLTLHTQPTINLGHDTTICGSLSSPITLNAGAGSGYTYTWSTGASTQTISVTNGGTYSVNVTSVSGCSQSESITILVVGSGSNHHTYDTSVCSASSFPLLLNAPAIPGGSSNYYYWSDGNTGTSTNIYYAGTYYLTIYVDNFSCEIYDTFNVSVDTIHINNIVQCNTFNSYTVTAPTGYSSYLWSTGATTYSTVITNPGTYWIKAISGGGCTAIDTFKASIINPDTINPLKDTTICTPSYYYSYYANAYVNGALSYQWYDGYTTPYQYLYNYGYGSSTYWVNITFSGGCIVRDTFKVTTKEAPYVYLGADQTYCSSVISPPVILNAGTGTGYTYSWSPTGATTQSISVTGAGSYTVAVTYTNGCTTVDSITIRTLNLPPGHQIDTSVCSTSSFPLLLTGPTIPTGPYYLYYYWNPGYSYTNTMNVYVPGTYYLDIYVNNYSGGSCNIVDTFKVVMDSVHINNILECTSFTADTISAPSGFASYLWSTGATTYSAVITGPGTYWIKATSGGGCTAIDTFQASVINPNTIHPLKDTTVCSPSYYFNYFANAYVNGATGYLWSNGVTTPSQNLYAYGYGPNSYTVNIMLSGGCVVKDTFRVTTKQAPYVYLGADQTYCSNVISPPLVLNASAGAGYTYSWSPTGATTPTISVTSPGSYTVEVSSSNGCITIDSITIKTLNLPPGHQIDTSVCTTSSFPVLLTAPTLSLSGYYYVDYYWNSGGYGNTNYVYGAGSYLLDIDVYNAYTGGYCYLTDTFNVAIDTARPHISDIILCNTFNPDTVSAGLGFAHYAWSTGANTSSIVINSAGSYSVQVISTSGCLFTDTFSVHSYNLTDYHATDTCISSFPIVLISPTISGNTHYQWSNGTTGVSDFITSSGIYYVDILVNGGVCMLRDSFIVHYDTMRPHISNLNPCSPSTPDTVSVQSNFTTYQWSTGANTYSTVINGTGTFWVKVTDTAGCSFNKTFYVNNPPQKPIFNDTISCNSSAPIVLNAGGGYAGYLWSTGSVSQSITVNTSGSYWVTVKSDSGCLVKTNVNVNYYNSPRVNMLKDTSMCGLTPITINATYPNATSYLWNNGDTSPVQTLNATGTYWVIYTFTTTCTANDTFTVSIKNVQNADSIPNIVTPNGDNKNDYIDFGVFEFPTMQLEIFNRWGIKIFESNSPNVIWRPTCDDGTYYYTIAYTPDCSTSEETKTLKGFITVIR